MARGGLINADQSCPRKLGIDHRHLHTILGMYWDDGKEKGNYYHGLYIYIGAMLGLYLGNIRELYFGYISAPLQCFNLSALGCIFRMHGGSTQTLTYNRPNLTGSFFVGK